MAVISAVALPLLQILIRDNVATHGGMAEVGLLQGVMRVSDMYLGVATSVFTMYYFQRFSEIKDAGELVREAKRGFLLIVPTVAVASLVIYLLRDFIVRLIFTEAFLPMRDLFGWQMAGNVLKMIGWLFGYLLLAKANALAMAALELATIGVWWLLSIFFISAQGTVGATQAFATTYALYSIATFVRRRRGGPAHAPKLAGADNQRSDHERARKRCRSSPRFSSAGTTSASCARRSSRSSRRRTRTSS